MRRAAACCMPQHTAAHARVRRLRYLSVAGHAAQAASGYLVNVWREAGGGAGAMLQSHSARKEAVGERQLRARGCSMASTLGIMCSACGEGMAVAACHQHQACCHVHPPAACACVGAAAAGAGLAWAGECLAAASCAGIQPEDGRSSRCACGEGGMACGVHTQRRRRARFSAGLGLCVCMASSTRILRGAADGHDLGLWACLWYVGVGGGVHTQPLPPRPRHCRPGAVRVYRQSDAHHTCRGWWA